MASLNRRALRPYAFLLALVVAAAVAACARQTSEPTGDDPSASGAPEERIAELTRAVDEIIEREMDAIPMAGVSVAIARGDDVLVARGYGLADIENDVPATDETVYRIGSITKQFTAAAIMQLIESGDVSLDDPLTRFLPDYPMQGHTVTVEHLLNHTSGIKSYTGLGPVWRRTIPLDLSRDELVDLFKDRPFDFAPGERYRYNNSGYYLLGLIIEKASGQTYTEYLEEHVFPKAGLEATYYCDNRPIIPNRAEGYQIVDGEIVNDDPIGMRQPYAAGSLCSTVTDLVKWTRSLSGGAVVRPDSYEQMTTPGTLNDGSPMTYGFGLQIGEFEEHARVAHGGGINGFVTAMTHYPDDEVIVVVLTNSGDAHPGQLNADLSRLALGLPAPEILDLDLTDDELALYAGTYGTADIRVAIEAREGRLWLEGGGVETRLLSQGEHAFAEELDPHIRVRFVIREDRVAAIVVSPGGRLPRIDDERD